MSKRARRIRPLGVLPPDAGITDAHMRTIIALAIEEIPVDLRTRIAIKRPAVSWQDYDEARRAIAEHLVARIRESVRCDYGGSGATGGHG
ncbi:hypothetical protein [Aurantimonas coralicida]|uniref:hypothetical protein n=1 Tax=Aurantimonas coralicida TaxID=182270 RepID=UPI0023F15634|nr:hypothetical protein [Aurantimonas coralicida]